MPKKFPVKKIKAHRVYDLWEASRSLGCHKQTIVRWIKGRGLVADTSQKPWLIEGKDLKSFLGARQSKAKTRLALHHCLCLGCRVPHEPDGKMADYHHLSADTGRLTGLCPSCGALMNKVVKRADFEAIRAKIEATVQKASPRLVSDTGTLSHVNFAKERQGHGKAQQG